MTKYIVYCLERGMYWKGSYGYTHLKQAAGLFNEEQADNILEDANLVSLNEVKIKADEAPEFSKDFKLV